MSNVIENKNWPIPCHSSEKDKMKNIVESGGIVRLTYGVSMAGGEPFVAEINPLHEAKRKQIEQECKQKL